MGMWKVINKFPSIKSYITKKLFPTLQDIDWSRTIAYSYGSYGPIYFNNRLLTNERDKIELLNDIKTTLILDRCVQLQHCRWNSLLKSAAMAKLQ